LLTIKYIAQSIAYGNRTVQNRRMYHDHVPIADTDLYLEMNVLRKRYYITYN